MPVDLSGLSAQDRQDFEKRLKVYGLDVSHVQEPLVLSAGARVPLAYGPGRESARQPFVLQTTDFSAVKRMVGIDDRVFANTGSRVPLPGRIDLGSSAVRGTAIRSGIQRDAPAGGSFSAAPGAAPSSRADDDIGSVDLRMLDSEAVANVRMAARAFVRGNSELVTSYRPLVERAIGAITIPIFALLNIKVPNGSVLEFGPGINVVVAHEVEVESGGIIRSRGHLTITCTRLTRPGSRFIGGVIGATRIAGTFRPIFSEQ